MNEKKKSLIIFIAAAIVLCGVAAVGGFLMFGRQETRISRFEKLNLQVSGIRISEEYELICQGEQSLLSRYEKFYGNGEEQRRLSGQVTVATAQVIEQLNACAVLKWDGFHGEHPKYVLDGTMFRLELDLGEGKVIHADGSQNFPKHYYELENWLADLLREAE